MKPCTAEPCGHPSFTLRDLGWKPAFERHFEPYRGQFIPGRVTIEQRGQYTVLTEKGEASATVAGKVMHQALSREDYPAVGDWVVLSEPDSNRKTVIYGTLPRLSKFSRKVAGLVSEEQIVAANIDLVFICMGLDENYNLRRLERYLVVGWESGALPVVVLTKADVCEDLEERIRGVEEIAVGAEVLAVSSVNDVGLDGVRNLLGPGKTGALLGSSGVGKSTLINHLLGWERQATGEVRAVDGRGRHTTTYRELIVLSGGGLLVDTPGMRELQLMEAGRGVEGAFDDIEQLGEQCRFRDCRHQAEPGCAVKAAIEEGRLSASRLDNYERLQREQAMIERKAARRLAMLEKGNRKEETRQNVRLGIEMD